MPASCGEWLFSVCLLVTYVRVCVCPAPRCPVDSGSVLGRRVLPLPGRQSPHPTAFPSCLALDRLPLDSPSSDVLGVPQNPHGEDW